METVAFVVAVCFAVGVAYVVLRWFVGEGRALNSEWGE